MDRIEEAPEAYDLCGKVVNFGAERMESKKRFRVPKKEQVSF
jgi:hypothetical protein